MLAGQKRHRHARVAQIVRRLQAVPEQDGKRQGDEGGQDQDERRPAAFGARVDAGACALRRFCARANGFQARIQTRPAIVVKAQPARCASAGTPLCQWHGACKGA
jgi:hypothetical protein